MNQSDKETKEKIEKLNEAMELDETLCMTQDEMNEWFEDVWEIDEKYLATANKFERHPDCPIPEKCRINCDNPEDVKCCFNCSHNYHCNKRCAFIEEGFEFWDEK